MRPFTTLTGIAIPLGQANIDTDIIMPARWLKHVTRSGLGIGAFEALRADPANIFDSPRNKGAPILIAGRNFGCGSSREHACWALADLGVRCIIAPDFADIFAGNAVKNGILLVELPEAAIAQLLRAAASEEITVDLHAQTVTSASVAPQSFNIDPFRRKCLLEGLDDIDLTLAEADYIDMFEAKRAETRPWAEIQARQ
nr:3-isopropylmalate dehydratase small subunit [Sphingomonas sp. Y57]